MTVRVDKLTVAEWQAFARLRLRALSDAFGLDDPLYRREAQFTAGQWRRRIAEHAQFVVYVHNHPVGLIAGHRENADTVYLYSLWLAPEARGRNLSHALVDAALTWAREQQVRAVTLRVAVDNDVARGLYETFGFTRVGAADGDGEVAMRLRVG
ncbi:GNAT family N-acetyltransferase [Mycobacterium sp. MYCO198283]|uniref:GNAT family N-acetyltransferase n=1 Tax=Mycobacterium sp. MYCO198283 TaxID=2883505 RepID=UPI001E380134|nr:GNAT family N-acetyltransferase [Mycobacterium sp. MYCO198283]MCG5433596.1 GNAT family N-acetyltransferase [Mycobacterium sp. MYCO198283]